MSVCVLCVCSKCVFVLRVTCSVYWCVAMNPGVGERTNVRVTRNIVGVLVCEELRLRHDPKYH